MEEQILEQFQDNKVLQDKVQNFLNNKYLEKVQGIKGLQVIKESKFYDNQGIREHIGNYKDYAIMFKPSEIKLNEKELKMNSSLIKKEDVKLLKKINKNTIKKEFKKNNIKSLNFLQKASIVFDIINQIDALENQQEKETDGK